LEFIGDDGKASKKGKKKPKKAKGKKEKDSSESYLFPINLIYSYF
jgi:hypothetical protein